MAEISEYFNAATAAIANIGTRVGANPNAKIVADAYQKYLTERKAAGDGEVLVYDKWRETQSLETILPTVTDPNVRKQAADDAGAYLNADAGITKARADLTKDGKIMMTKAKGILNTIMEALQNNAFTAGALALGAVAGNALGLGAIGTALVAIGSAVAGGLFGDKETGFIGKLFGLDIPPIPKGIPFAAPGNGPMVGVIMPPGPVVPTPVAENTIPDKAMVREYTEAKPSREAGATQDPDKYFAVVVSADRQQQFIGVKNASGEFEAKYVRITDAKEAKDDKDKKIDTTWMSVAETKLGPLILKMNDKNEVIFDATAKAKAIEIGNRAIEQAASRKSIPEAEQFGAKLGDKIQVTTTPTKYTIRDEPTNNRTVAEISGYAQDGMFVITHSSNSGKDNNPENITKFEEHKHQVKVPLEINGTLDTVKALAVVKKERAAEAAGMYIKDRAVVVDAFTMVTKSDELSVNGTVRSSEKTKNPDVASVNIEFKGKLEGSGPDRTLTITDPLKVDGFETKVKPIVIKIGDLKPEDNGDQKKIIDMLQLNPEFRDSVRSVTDTSGIPVVYEKYNKAEVVRNMGMS